MVARPSRPVVRVRRASPVNTRTPSSSSKSTPVPAAPMPGVTHSVAGASISHNVSEKKLIFLPRTGSPYWSVSVAVAAPGAPLPSSDAISNSLRVETTRLAGREASSDQVYVLALKASPSSSCRGSPSGGLLSVNTTEADWPVVFVSESS